ncbi:MAG: DUF2156 domain-containing protein, partial [Firmicutes bacterium]|nr:DUF2156 domain-containing protein [Bacillota bacterium]
ITIGDRVVFDSDEGINIPANKRKVGFLFQNYALWPNMTVYENISFGLTNVKEELPEEWRTILQLESQAIQLLLEFVGTGQLFTGLIRVDGKVEAVSIGEYSCPISKEAVLVHVEKANPEIRGLYQAINKEFCRHLPDHVIYVNREEDMGMENLRQTKLSYKPVRLAEKYSAVWKQTV